MSCTVPPKENSELKTLSCLENLALQSSSPALYAHFFWSTLCSSVSSSTMLYDEHNTDGTFDLPTHYTTNIYMYIIYISLCTCIYKCIFIEFCVSGSKATSALYSLYSKVHCMYIIITFVSTCMPNYNMEGVYCTRKAWYLGRCLNRQSSTWLLPMLYYFMYLDPSPHSIITCIGLANIRADVTSMH